jgi:hypothetical protein
MKTVRETVALPDEKVQPLVHPLDLAEARRPFLVSWWLTVPAMPSVVFFLAALLWSVSNNYVTPILVPLLIAIGSGVLSSFLGKEAWAHIPRRRHDSSRPLPAWSVLRAVISTASLLAGLVLATVWIVRRDVGTDVLGYIVGSAGGILLLMVVGLLWTALAPGGRSAALGSWTSQVAGLVAVAAALMVGLLIIGARYDLADLAPRDMLMGAGVMIAIQALWWLAAFRRSRKASGRTAAPTV